MADAKRGLARLFGTVNRLPRRALRRERLPIGRRLVSKAIVQDPVKLPGELQVVVIGKVPVWKIGVPSGRPSS